MFSSLIRPSTAILTRLQNHSRRTNLFSMSAHAIDLDKLLGNVSVSDTPEDKLIIALDFGTTYSGIAYCFTNQRDCTPLSVKNWPGAESPDAPKVPTLIKYNKENPNEFEWGATLNNHTDGIVGLKLLLDPEQERPSYFMSSRKIRQRELKSLPKHPSQVTADFLGAIYKHAISEISKRFSKAYIELCCKEYVLTVPAVWSDAAKNATLKAAEMAGLSPIHLIKEPEAAALWTARKMDRRLYPDDNFIVCDAGGGTVDLVSYKVEAALPRLQVKEIVPGTGGMSGSLGLNKKFADAVEDLVGDDQWKNLKKSKAFHLANRQFDRDVKRLFRGGADEEYFINFPTANLEDDAENGLESCSWRMTRDDLRLIFNPLITDILMLINDQVQKVKLKEGAKSIKGLFLVGGFGSNHYLMSRVKAEHPDIEILQPPDAWAAIAKGAALSRMPREAIVTSTSATRHYGVDADCHIDPILDIGRPTKVWPDGSLRVSQMTWYINIGDDLLRDQKIKFSFCRNINYNYSQMDLIFSDELYECGSAAAPRHPFKGDKFALNCSIISNLSRLPASKFEKRIDHKGKPYWSVHFDLVITLESAIMKFALEVDGESFGSVEAKYN